MLLGLELGVKSAAVVFGRARGCSSVAVSLAKGMEWACLNRLDIVVSWSQLVISMIVS